MMRNKALMCIKSHFKCMAIHMENVNGAAFYKDLEKIV